MNDKQHTSFNDTDTSPCWMNENEKSSNKYDNDRSSGLPDEVVPLKNMEMLVDLRKKSVDTTNKRYGKKELKAMCNLHNIGTVKSVGKITPGWCNKPKGMLQVLFERGYIDPSLVKTPKCMRYSKKGKEVDIGEDGELTENGFARVLTKSM